MNDSAILAHLRLFLLGVAGSIFAGTIVELILANHLKDTVQWIPFTLCGLGILAVIIFWLKPQPIVLRWLRGCMAFIVVGSLLGIYEHLAGNYNFQLEIQPNASWWEQWLKTLTGADPLLAPGILILAATLAVAATYEYPTTPLVD